MLDLLPLLGLLLQALWPLRDWRLYRRLRGGRWLRTFADGWTRSLYEPRQPYSSNGFGWLVEDYRHPWEKARDRLVRDEDRT